MKNNSILVIAIIILFGVLCFMTYLLISSKFYFIGKVDPSFIGNSFWEVNLSSCSKGQVLMKTGSGWDCRLDNEGNVLGGGWDRDYDEACSACNICGVYWGEGSCTAVSGSAASFQCSQGAKKKIAEYGVSKQKTYWYVCIPEND